MNYITVVITALTIIPIVFGALLGLLRGSRRALLRLVLVMVSIGLALALYGVVSTAVMNVQIDALGGSVVNYLHDIIMNSMSDSMSENMINGMSEFATNLAQSLLQLIVFLLLFFVTWLLTWAILYPLCKLFVKKGKRPHRLIGLAVGAVQGVLVAACVCIVLSGLLIQTNNVMVAGNNLMDIMGDVGETRSVSEESAESSDGKSMGMLGDILNMAGDYSQSGLANMYDSIGGKLFARISQVKVDEETTITLPGQVEAVCGLADMAGELVNLQGVNFNDFLTEANIQKLDGIFTELNNIKVRMSDEARNTVNKLMKIVGKEMGVDLSNLEKIAHIDFKKEGEIFARLYDYKTKDISQFTEQDVETILRDMAQSEIILDVLQQQNDVNLNSQIKEEAHVQMVTDIIHGMEADDDISQEKIDALKHIFGIQ